MKNKMILAALLLASAAPAYAQDTLNSNSGSNAAANSGSASGAESNGNIQGQTANNAGIGSSRNENTSTSASGAISGSNSRSGSVSDQQQGQALDNTNSLSTAQTNMQGQQATNSQGVTVDNTFNTTNRKVTEFRTNAAVPLAASSSFSSDYCGGTASVGASASPIGISIGGAKPVMDHSCQSLRRAEKFGMAAANYYNMQQPDMALKMMSMMVWSICTADSTAAADRTTAEACSALLGSASSPPSPPPAYVKPAPPEAATPQAAPQAQSSVPTVPYTGERGDATSNRNMPGSVAGDALSAADLPSRNAMAFNVH